MTQCTRCRARCDTYGCPRCVADLRKLLADLPWWLRQLEITATGQSKLGDDGRHTRRPENRLNGDLSPFAPFPVDEEPNLAKARHEREQAVLLAALASGRVNARAVELADQIRAMLTEWVRDLCETRGIALPTFEAAPVTARHDQGVRTVPMMDADDVHVARGSAGEMCEECWTFHRGECA